MHSEAVSSLHTTKQNICKGKNKGYTNPFEDPYHLWDKKKKVFPEGGATGKAMLLPSSNQLYFVSMLPVSMLTLEC